MRDIIKLKSIITQSKNITVISGAGISTESGIPDFRSNSKLYDGLNLETVLSESYFNRHPKKFWKHYKEIFQMDMMNEWKPNYGHMYLADLEYQGKEITIITQNVDGLHQAAGSKTVYEIHGNLKNASCVKCKREYLLNEIKDAIPRCEKDDFILKPNIVLYGGMTRFKSESVEASYNADLLLILGTSLKVSPANLLPINSVKSGITTVIINKEPTDMDSMFDLVIHDSIGGVFKS